MPDTLRSPRHQALCAWLIEQRRQAGLKQTDVAKRLRRNQSFVSDVERGERRLDLIEIVDYAEAVGFDPRDALKVVQGRVRRGRSI